MRQKLLKKAVYCLAAAGTLFPMMGSAVPVVHAQQQYIDDVEDTLNSLTLREKICQMFVMQPVNMPAVDGKVYATTTGNALKKSLEAYPVGGIIYFANSVTGHDQFKDLITTTQSYSKIPLIIAIDEEGGRVARIGKTLNGYQYPQHAAFSDMLTYESQGPEVAKSNANIIGQNLAHYGVTLDYAPVADTNSNPNNPVINTRAYSTDFDTGAELVGAAVQGYHSAGIGTTLKHFPGHGDTQSDTHAGTVYLNKPLSVLRRDELRPFRAGIQNGTDVVMIAHLIVNEIGKESLFSTIMVKDLLMEEMGFEGLVTTDGISGMKAMTDNYNSAEIAVRGIESGIDLFCDPASLPEAVDAVEQAVLDGRLTEERIDESVRKILTFKKNHQ